jgi:tight adherence protein B
MFHLSSIVLSLAIAIMVATVADRFILPISLLAGPLIMRLALRRSVERRTKRFSDDYPQFLMTVVSLLKTGMTPSGALEEAARGLEPESLVRTEVLLMIERVRVGISEEKSIGGFAETIEHPEIELFVQSLLLGLRVGGSLADSLERLSKQVRKRQHFRSSAIASVTQQRGSMIAIAIIMGGLAAFVSLTMPDMVRGLCTNPTGWVVVQVCVVTVIVAVVWFRSITRIKV